MLLHGLQVATEFNWNDLKWWRKHISSGCNDGSVLISGTWTLRVLCVTVRSEFCGLKVDALWHHSPCRWEKAHFVSDLLVSLYLFLSHRGLIASPVKLLLLMMGQWGMFVIRYYTPPLLYLPLALRTSIFPWPSKTTSLLSHTGCARLMQLYLINTVN